MKSKYSLRIISDKKIEPFSVSYCDCKKCESMQKSHLEWKFFKKNTSLKTSLQRRMIKVIAKIERDIKKIKSI